MLDVFACLFEVPFNPCLCVSRHCRRTTLSLFFPKIWQLLSCSCGHFSVLVNATVVRFAYALSACQVHLMKKRTSVSPDQRVSSIFSTWAPDCASFLPFQCRARTRIRTFFAGGERTDIPRLVLSPILEPFRTFLLLLAENRDPNIFL